MAAGLSVVGSIANGWTALLNETPQNGIFSLLALNQDVGACVSNCTFNPRTHFSAFNETTRRTSPLLLLFAMQAGSNSSDSTLILIGLIAVVLVALCACADFSPGSQESNDFRTPFKSQVLESTDQGTIQRTPRQSLQEYNAESLQPRQTGHPIRPSPEGESLLVPTGSFSPAQRSPNPSVFPPSSRPSGSGAAPIPGSLSDLRVPESPTDNVLNLEVRGTILPVRQESNLEVLKTRQELVLRCVLSETAVSGGGILVEVAHSYPIAFLDTTTNCLGAEGQPAVARPRSVTIQRDHLSANDERDSLPLLRDKLPQVPFAVAMEQGGFSGRTTVRRCNADGSPGSELLSVNVHHPNHALVSDPNNKLIATFKPMPQWSQTSSLLSISRGDSRYVVDVGLVLCAIIAACKIGSYSGIGR